MKNNIPDTAKKVSYNYGLLKGYFYIWPIRCAIGPDKWDWQAAGNGGREVTQELAIQTARQWIINSSKFKFNEGEQ